MDLWVLSSQLSVIITKTVPNLSNNGQYHGYAGNLSVEADDI